MKKYIPKNIRMVLFLILLACVLPFAFIFDWLREMEILNSFYETVNNYKLIYKFAIQDFN